MTYTIMPTDMIEAEKYPKIMSASGSYPYMTKSYVVNKIKELKKEYPHIQLELYKGDTWGTMELVKVY